MKLRLEKERYDDMKSKQLIDQFRKKDERDEQKRTQVCNQLAFNQSIESAKKMMTERKEQEE